MATYAPKLEKGEGWIDWGRPARSIECQVRGLKPWPRAFTEWVSDADGGATRIFIDRAEADWAFDWLLELAGIPFGLFGEMLQNGGNQWRGMLYGITCRTADCASLVPENSTVNARHSKKRPFLAVFRAFFPIFDVEGES